MSYYRFDVIEIKNFVLLFFFILLFSSESEADWKSEREALNHIYVTKGFRLFYSLNGKHALSNKQDNDRSGIPDIVENVAIQLHVANQLFSEVFKFVHPMENNRYQNQLQTIDIHFLALKNNGNSGDAVINYHYKKVKADALTSLSITISRQITVGNLTPAHELFHAYQNGYTLFKNRWLTEGTARWIEYAFRQESGKQKPLPYTTQLLDQLLKQTYNAQFFWNRIAFFCAKDQKQYTIPAELEHSHYLLSPEKVIKGKEFSGYGFMLKLFQNLSLLDVQASLQRGLDKYHWKEAEQKSIKNNYYILMALKKTIKQGNCNTNEEINNFLLLIDNFIQ